MSLNIDNTRRLLQDFNFQELFREELGWQNPSNRRVIPFETKEGLFYRRAVAELSGATVFEITNDTGSIPDAKTRAAISTEIQEINFEHILIFVDHKHNEGTEKITQTVWRWLKKGEKKSLPREHYFSRGQTGDAFIAKLSNLMIDLSEMENDITITDVARKMQTALDLERITKRFFKEYQQQYVVFLQLIEGIDIDADRRWYASVLLDRLMFIYFLQQKGFLNNGDRNYLYKKLKEVKASQGANKYYSVFLEALFFEGFAKPETKRSAVTNKLLGKIVYLNGGLFLKHKIEEKYKGKIKIADKAFENLLNSDEPKGLFEQFSWSLDDTPGGKDDEINPDVLGYIFEKYINQKAFGAYYTRTEITEYLCEQTVYKLVLDAVNGQETEEETAALKKFGLNGNGNAKPRYFESVAELLLNLDAATCRRLVYGDNAVLPNLTLLDPACGSGAFLVAAMKTLINVYAAILGRIEFLGDKKLLQWKQEIERDHPSINYYIKKRIITHNLYGVDIMEEATEIAKLRLFLTLVSSAQTVDQLEPLPNIDFNIMYGNSLIGMMRVDETRFNTLMSQPKKNAAGKVVKPATLFSPGTSQANLFAADLTQGYLQLINEKERLIRDYKNARDLDVAELQELRNNIQTKKAEATAVLNQLLVEEFTTLGIQYETTTWDEKANKPGKSVKRLMTIEDIQALEPFHWGYEFSEIFKKKDGFDAIITNPPWEIFKPNSKEFFAEYSKLVSKKKMDIKEFEKEQKKLLKDPEIRQAWLNYQDRFPHVSAYYRSAAQYKNQISLINGKKAGSDINLYKLFTEQCYNLLKGKGYCGIIIPSGIYTDLGSMQLRKLLFEKARIQQLVSFANEKFIFENVHHAFKFCFLSFEKGGTTDNFLATFRINPRECIAAKDLDSFLHAPESFIRISTKFIYKQSPESLSIMEVRQAADFNIAEKLLRHRSLGEVIEGKWSLTFGSEFHMTGDSSLFKVRSDVNYFPLYEGKMIHQFTHQWQDAAPRYWIKEKAARKALLGKEKDNGQILEYQTYRIALRAIARSSDSRTIITALLPKNVFCGNSLLVSDASISGNDTFVVVAFLNSYVVDYYIRQVVSANLNMFYIYQLPIPRLTSKDKWHKPIAERTAKLICTTDEFAELWEETMKTKWSKQAGATDEAERNKLRAELDAIVAHIYGLSEEEFSYVLTTFPLAADKQKQTALEYFKKIAPKFSVDQVDWKSIIDAGESPFLEFKSTLRVNIRAGNIVDKKMEQMIMKTLAAYLNSGGGTLLIGVDDSKNVLGLDLDFASFTKGHDKLDEFQKHFDTMIQNGFGNRFHRYLDISYPEVEGKTICAIVVKEKSSEPVYYTDENKQEIFYVRRQASTIDLKPSETVKYINDHWK